MSSIGIDIGSRAVKLVEVEEGTILDRQVVPNSHDPIVVCQELLAGRSPSRIVATGYGRHLLARYFGCEVLTEIRAAAIGTRFLLPQCRTILDIGGQDTKAIALDPTGSVAKFEMNDRCAAGTGKFLEMMATALTLSLEDFIDAALKAKSASKVSAMCAVFAESEVVSLVARGEPRPDLALGIHESIATRSLSLVRRLHTSGPLAFIGGVARNRCLVEVLGRHLGEPVTVPIHPQFVNALGAALM